jgi:hypothetical protein
MGGVLRLFVPTYRRIAVFLFFSVLPMLAVMLEVRPIEVFFGMPYFLYGSASIGPIIGQIIYSYVLACIYAGAYVGIEAHLRKNYPHLNDVVKQRRLLPERKAKVAAMPAAKPAVKAKPKPKRKKRR